MYNGCKFVNSSPPTHQNGRLRLLNNMLLILLLIITTSLCEDSIVVSKVANMNTNNNNLVEIATVQDPTWLAQLWPKLRNGVHISLEPSCWRNMTVFFQDLLDGRAYAMSAVDATGGFSSGLLWGNAIWPGSHQECKDLDDRYLDFIRNSSGKALSVRQYASWMSRQNTEVTGHNVISSEVLALAKMSLLDRTPPFRMSFSAAVLSLNITKVTIKSNQFLQIGFCLPRACDSENVQHLIDFSVKTYQSLKVSSSLPRTIKVLAVRSIKRDYSPFEDSKFRILGFSALIFASLIFLGTLAHVYEEKEESQNEIILPKFKSFKNPDYAFTLTNQMSEIPGSLRFGQNKINQMVPGFNLLPEGNALSVNHNRNINLITVKKIVNKKNNPSITLDIIATRRGSPGSDILPECKNPGLKKKKYQVTQSRSFLVDRRHIRDFLIVFSLKTNIKKLFMMEVGDRSLPVVHGAKVLMMLWIMLAHSALIIYYISDNQMYRGKMESNILYQTVASATYSVDTFFVLSGTLVSYLYHETVKKYQHSDEKKLFDGFLGKTAQFVVMVLYRYLRLTPPYLAIMLMVEVSSRYFRHHSFIMQAGNNDINCAKYWWRNVLYINTFYPVKEMCLTWSWYLSIDTQLYVIGSLILVLSSAFPRTAAAFISILIFSSLSAVGLLTFKSGFIASVEHPLANYDDIYDKPWVRIAPYFIGICTGWFLSKKRRFVHISKKTNTTFWTLSILIFLLIMYGLQIVSLGPRGSAIYLTLSHSAWGLAVSWILIACSTERGWFFNRILSWKLLYPISRLSYCAYLLHPALLQAIFSSNGMPQHLTIANVILSFLGSATAVFILSFIICILFESPVVSLLRLAIPNHKNLDSKSCEKL